MREEEIYWASFGIVLEWFGISKHEAFYCRTTQNNNYDSNNNCNGRFLLRG